jgi:hypothetical protein
MKAGNVVLCGALLGALLVPGRTLAQIEDDFAGGFDPSIPWTWMVTGNNPVDTEDPTNYSFSDSSLDIMAQSGSLYASNNNAHNIPSLVILGQPDSWYVETAVSTDWSMADPTRYVHAGLIFLADADNYFSFYNNIDAGGCPPQGNVQVSSTAEFNANPRYGGISSNDWTPTTDDLPLVLRVEGTPTQITFMYSRDGGNTLLVAGTVTASNQPDVFAFLTSLTGSQVGLETDTGGGFNNSPFSFHYFKTNLVVVGCQ